MNSSNGPQERRIAYVLKVYPRFSQTFVLNEILAHQRAGYPVDVFSLRRPNDCRFHAMLAAVESPVRYLDQPIGMEEFWCQVRQSCDQFPELWRVLGRATRYTALEIAQGMQLAVQVRRLGIDHLHAHFGNTAAAVAHIAADIAGITYSFTAHAKDIFHDSVQTENLFQKIRDASCVVTVSDFNREFLQMTFPSVSDRLERVYNGLNLESLPFDDPVKREPLVLGVGRLVEKKGFDVLIAACDVLKRRGHEFACQIIGSGPLESALRRQITQLQLQNIISLVGALPSEQVQQRIQRASVLAAPCVIASDGDRDGLPTVILEAMALGTPCVATRVTGIPEAVQDEVTGLLVPPADVTRLTDACETLLVNCHRRRELAQSARKVVEESFCVDRNTRRLRQIFDDGRLPAMKRKEPHLVS